MNDVPPTELISRWVGPLYMDFFKPSSDSIIEALWLDMGYGIASSLLSYCNWRPRTVGAYIAALKRLDALTELIGRLLLRSDVCFAGGSYCLALTKINTSESRQFLFEYLDYYLTRGDLWFDQGVAMGAVAYLDGINGTSEELRFIEKWETFTRDKPHWDLAQSHASFSGRMARINGLVSARLDARSRFPRE